jgi:hypothetical protein
VWLLTNSFLHGGSQSWDETRITGYSLLQVFNGKAKFWESRTW